MTTGVESYGERVVFLMRMVSSELTRQLDQELRATPLTRSQLGALSQLGLEHPGALSGAVLSERAGVTPQSMSAAIGSLEERGLVARAASPDHGRRIDVRITQAGMAVLGDVQEVTGRLDERAVASLSPEEQRVLGEALQTMMRDLGLFVPGR